MSDFLPDPPRWKDRADQARLAERDAGRLVRALGTAEPLSGAQLTRIAAHISAGRPHPHRLHFWVPAAAVLLLFGGVAAASAARIRLLPHWLVDIVKREPAAPARSISSPRTARPKPAVPAAAPVSPALPDQPAAPVKASTPDQPVLAPPPPVLTVPKDSPSRRARQPARKTNVAEVKPFEQVVVSRPLVPERPSQPQPSVPVAPVPIDRPALPSAPRVQTAPATQLAWVERPTPARHPEPVAMIPDKRAEAASPASETGGAIKYLSIAIHALRVEHSPETALALLDHYAGDLDKSTVRHEALLLRVEAMLKLKREPEVLKLLDDAPLAGVAASRTLLLTRGELRMAAGRCGDALADFDLVLAQTQGHSRRALGGRAKCRQQLGEEDGRVRADGASRK